MPQLQPMPLFLNETAGADRGLICGYQLQPDGPAREVNADGIVQARRWLLDAAFLPTALREVLQEHDANRRVEWTDGGLLLVTVISLMRTNLIRRRSRRCGATRGDMC